MSAPQVQVLSGQLRAAIAVTREARRTEGSGDSPVLAYRAGREFGRLLGLLEAANAFAVPLPTGFEAALADLAEETAMLRLAQA